MSVSVNPLPAGAAAGGLTDAQLRATPVPVSGTVATTATDGALATVGTTTDAEAAGNGTLVALLKRIRTLLAGGLPAALAANGGLKIEGVASGTAVPVSGTVTASGPLTDTQLRASAVPVSGTFFQSTQPVSLATNTPDVTDRAARLLGHVTVDSAPTTAVTGPLTDTQLRASAVPVSGTFFQGTQPVSGTVTANQGTAAAAAGAWTAKVTDGTNTAAVKAASTAAAAADPSLVVALHPTSPLPAGTNAIGALTANQSVNLAQVAGTTASTGSRVTDAGVQSVFLAAPTAANILVGHQAFTATTAATTVITVPINRTWVGTITITTDVSNTAVTGTTAGQALGTVTTAGASATPAAGTVATCEARVGANTATIGGGAGASNSITVPMVVSAGATALATIQLASTQAGTNSRVACIASGYLV